MRLIDADSLKMWKVRSGAYKEKAYADGWNRAVEIINQAETVDTAPVVHGRWILEVHKERANYRWHVSAKCSECGDEIEEIWSGFFPNVPDYLVRYISIINAKEVELSNYCSNCGTKMDLEG